MAAADSPRLDPNPVSYRSRNARTGEPLDGYTDAGPAEVDSVMRAAADAVSAWSSTDGDQRAKVLRSIADALESNRAELVRTADLETGLGDTRLSGELERTQNQLHLYASILRGGGLLPPVQDRVMMSAGAPSVSLTRMHIPVGPVVVFPAGNFPFAFSVAGTDTAAALAAGCPVVVKIHPLHPMTSQITAQIVSNVLREHGTPPGTFAAVHGFSANVGESLVRHPATAAVAFTGSKAAGLALSSLAAGRPEPVPFYGELGSVNPVVVCPAASQRRSSETARAIAGSILQGYGQFCTSPGMVISFSGEDLARQLADELGGVAPLPMLGERIAQSFGQSVQVLEGQGIRQLLADRQDTSPAVFVATPREVRDHPDLAEEIFGPACVVVPITTVEEAVEVIGCLGGQLTGTVFALEEDAELAERVAQTLLRKCGRLVWNGVPTGVAVSPAMHHGGPYPASTEPGATSVGSQAMARFLRPVCLQDVPEDLVRKMTATASTATPEEAP